MTSSFILAAKRYLLKFQFVRELDLKLRGSKWHYDQYNLDEIERTILPANARFQSLGVTITVIEGMFSPFSMAAMDMALAFQEEIGAKGDILEIGTYRGKSAAILGHHLHGSERLVLVDIADYLDRDAIKPFSSRVDFIVSDSQRLKEVLPHYGTRRGSFRFVHVDASHGYEQTFAELQMADELLAPLGLISLDDFTNLNYSQNMAAIFRYLYSAKTSLVVLMVTDEKVYLCRRKAFNLFADKILRRAIAEMDSRGIQAVIARTSYGSQYKAFYLRRRISSEDSAFYSREAYRNQIVGI